MPASEESIGVILVQLCGAFRQQTDLALRELGLHVGQEKILLHLWRKEGLTQTQLKELLGCTPPTVTNMLQRLERSGLVTRYQDPADARVTRVYLTDRGRALEDPARELWKREEDCLIAGLTHEERLLLRRLLLQMRSNLP